MIAGIIKTLESKDMDERHWVYRFRNHNSGGTSSMDLDLVLSSEAVKWTFVLQKGGIIPIKKLMNDAQAMNDEYYKLFGISARLSDMNLL